MDLTSTSPASREMPHEGDNCGAWMAATPHLIHRQDRQNVGKTILHRLCEGNDNDIPVLHSRIKLFLLSFNFTINLFTS